MTKLRNLSKFSIGLVSLELLSTLALKGYSNVLKTAALVI